MIPAVRPERPRITHDTLTSTVHRRTHPPQLLPTQFGGPEQVLKYLAQYTHRVAIGNSRLVSLEQGRVTFRYKDYADAAKTKTMTLEGVELLRRWVQHVLPSGLVKIRHYGLLANRYRAEKLRVCRRLLLALGCGLPVCVAEPEVRPDRCPLCGVESWLIGERFGRFGEESCRESEDSS